MAARYTSFFPFRASRGTGRSSAGPVAMMAPAGGDPTGYDPNDSTKLAYGGAPTAAAGAGTDPVAMMSARFDQEHPFAPASLRPDGLRPAGYGGAGQLGYGPSALMNPAYGGGAPTRTIDPDSAPNNGGAAGSDQATTDALTAGFAGGMYPRAAGGFNPAAMMPGGVPGANPGLLVAAAGLDDRTRQLQAQRAYRLKVAPNLPQPWESPEIQANKEAYLRKLVEDEMSGQRTMAPELAQPDMIRKFDLTGASPRPSPRMSAPQMAAMGHKLMAQSQLPQYSEDPVTGERFAVYGKDIVRSGRNPKLAPGGGVEPVSVGEKNYFYHGASKRFFDEKGAPVSWPQSAMDLSALGGGPAGAEPAETGTGGGGIDELLGGGAKPGAADKGKSPEIPEAAIAHLRANPAKASQFEAKYGKGAAGKYLK